MQAGITIDLSQTYGITIVGADPNNPATILVSKAHGVYIFSWTQPKGLGITVSDLIIKGDGTLLANGKTTGGVYVLHMYSSVISGLTIQNVQASGFTEAGVYLGRWPSSMCHYLCVEQLYSLASSSLFSRPGLFWGFPLLSGCGFAPCSFHAFLFGAGTRFISRGALNLQRLFFHFFFSSTPGLCVPDTAVSSWRGRAMHIRLCSLYGHPCQQLLHMCVVIYSQTTSDSPAVSTQLSHTSRTP